VVLVVVCVGVDSEANARQETLLSERVTEI
jgi:hypothetical protein